MGHALFPGNGFGEMIYAFKMSDWLGQTICVLLFLLLSEEIWRS